MMTVPRRSSLARRGKIKWPRKGPGVISPYSSICFSVREILVCEVSPTSLVHAVSQRSGTGADASLISGHCVEVARGLLLPIRLQFVTPTGTGTRAREMKLAAPTYQHTWSFAHQPTCREMKLVQNPFHYHVGNTRRNG